MIIKSFKNIYKLFADFKKRFVIKSIIQKNIYIKKELKIFKIF